MPALSIVRPGMLTTVQDLGRWGYQSQGVPVSGAMDTYSHRLANRLVGNDESSATLEVTLIGPHIAFESDTTIAVTGAAFDVTLDDVGFGVNRALTVKQGSSFKFGSRGDGARAYLAVAGGVAVPPVLGSRSTHIVGGIGGVEGRALKAGDRLSVGAADPSRRRGPLTGSPLPLPRGGTRLRAIPGDAVLFRYLSATRFVISPRSDRMGYRLDGGTIGAPAGELISTAVATGTVQIPPGGQPILLMADHATTGGYAIAAVVITADLPLAGQLAPGDWIEFEECSLQAADEALRRREAALAGS